MTGVLFYMGWSEKTSVRLHLRKELSEVTKARTIPVREEHVQRT